MPYEFKELYSGSVGGGGIIEVDQLPTENIDENVFYLVGGKYYKWAETGALVFKRNITVPEAMLGNAYRCGFSVNTPTDGVQTIDMIAFDYSGYVIFMRDRDSYSIDAWYTGGWYNELYRTITITEAPTDATFIDWLDDNATAGRDWQEYVNASTDNELPTYDGTELDAYIGDETETDVIITTTFETPTIVEDSVCSKVPLEQFGDARPNDVRRGVTCTSSAGVAFEGTADGFGGGIIEVDQLPTENIDENTFYIVGGKYYKWAEPTWTFKDWVTYPQEILGNTYSFRYSSTDAEGEVTFNAMYFGANYEGNYRYISYKNDETGYEVEVYNGRITNYPNGWHENTKTFKTIKIHEMPTDETFLAWLNDNTRTDGGWKEYMEVSAVVGGIIEVDQLPTENIDENAFYLVYGNYYKMVEGSWVEYIPLSLVEDIVSGDNIVGTWVFNDKISWQGYEDEFNGKTYYFDYHITKSDGTVAYQFNRMEFEIKDSNLFISFCGDDNSIQSVYTDAAQRGWGDEFYKTITITKAPEDVKIILWIITNATKQESGDIIELGDDEPLPTNKNANTTKLYLKNNRYYKYTIPRTDTGTSVYVFNDNIGANGAQELMGKTYYFEYSVNIPDVGKVKMTEMTFEFDGTYLVINYNNNDLNFDEAYNERNGWANEMLKTIEIHEVPDDETFKDWLFAEAVVKGTWVEYAPTPVDDSVVGTWVFKEDIEIPSKNFEVKFTSDDRNYVAIEVDEDDFLFYSYEIGDYSDPAFTNYHGWETQSYRTIKITEESTDATFISWLKENATKQASTSTGATAHTVQSVDELPSDAIDGSMALVESSGSYSLYIRQNGEWVYGGEVNMSGGTGGENYQTCEILVMDQDCCGPYKVTYKAYENGSLVDKDAVVQNGDTVTINAVQGEEMFIEVYVGGSSISGIMVESDGEYMDVESRYENGGLYTTVPSVSECYVFICG